jgi:D-apionolactonase
LFSAAWTLGYVATLARSGAATISMGAPTGPLGMVYREAEHTQPFFDDLEAVAVYPVFHTMSALNRASGNAIVSTACSDVRSIAAFGWRDKSNTVVMIANLTAEEKIVEMSGAGPEATIGMLDEESFVNATTNPKAFRKAGQLLGGAKQIRLGGYAVAYISY